MEWIVELLGGAMGAALVAGVFTAINTRKSRKDAKSKALRYIMLYIIQERAKQHIRENIITLEERRSLHHWHDLYHHGLGGNGDADALMQQVDHLRIECEE